MKYARAAIFQVINTLVFTSAAVPVLAQEYSSSVVGTEFDFIVDEDPSTFLCLEFKGQRLREMPDKVNKGELVQSAFVFMAYYEDGTKVDIALDAAFATESAAREDALRYATRLGKLPTTLRSGVERLVVHAGPTDATAFSDIGVIALYSANATKRIGTHDLEETLFHESVHAAWDARHRESAEWLAAQTADGVFLTAYGAKNSGEDLTESALFAYTLVHHPERIPAGHAARIRAVIPARIAFVEKLVPPGKPIFYSVGPRYACDGSGTTFTVDDARASRAPSATKVCTVDVTTFGGLTDVLSNALMRGLGQDEPKVHAFLVAAKKRRGMTADQLLDAAVVEFGIDRARIVEQVQAFLHCNCKHGDLTKAVARTDGLAEPSSPASAPVRSMNPVSSINVDLSQLHSLLGVIAALLALLLVVSTATFVVLIKRPNAGTSSGMHEATRSASS